MSTCLHFKTMKMPLTLQAINTVYFDKNNSHMCIYMQYHKWVTLTECYNYLLLVRLYFLLEDSSNKWLGKGLFII